MRRFFLLLMCSLAAVAQQPPAFIQDITDQPPGLVERENEWLKWTERVVRLQNPARCGNPEGPCTVIHLVVWNPGDKFMKCGGSLAFEQPNPKNVGNATANNVLVAPKAEAVIVMATAPGSLPFTRDSQCVPTEPPPPSPGAVGPTTTAIVECAYSFTQSPNINDFYPPDARAAERQGKVYLQFTLPQTEGAPTDIIVYQSSSYADIDAAGIKALASARFKTNCEGRRYRAAIKFSFK